MLSLLHLDGDIGITSINRCEFMVIGEKGSKQAPRQLAIPPHLLLEATLQQLGASEAEHFVESLLIECRHL